MIRVGLHSRVLLAALVPVALVAIALAGLFTARQISGLEEALAARALAESRQLANAAQFGIFAGNRELLERLVRNMNHGDTDIIAVTLLDGRGKTLARSGISVLDRIPEPRGEERHFTQGGALIVLMPIRGELLAVEDIYSGVAEPANRSRLEGQVVLEMSLESLRRERRHLIALALAVALLGLTVGGVLAVRIARGVTRPMLHISDVVARIAGGDLTARVTPDPAATVRGLENGINDMARRIASAQDDLREQIAAATAELRARKEDAEAATSAKSRFLAAASHDLRQPMHALGLFVSRLSRMQLDHATHGIVRYIESSVSALQDMLDILLDVSRIDAGLVVPRLTSFPLEDLFERLEHDMSEPAQRKGLRFRRRGCGDLHLCTDVVLLERILQNLLGNALRYTQRGGILLACRRRRNMARIEVWDTGIGIPPEQQHAIFQEYVQLANPERDRAKGLGLGLAICDRLARLLGAELRLRSVPGRGSVFRLDLPLVDSPPAPAAAAGEGPAATVGGALSGTVLIVDDDALVLASTAELVAAWGCTTYAESSVAAAMAACDAAHCRPDVAICDYRLRGLENGIDSARALRARYGDIAVLMLSGDLGDELRREAEAHGFVLLSKPLKPARLRALLHHLLQGAGDQR